MKRQKVNRVRAMLLALVTGLFVAACSDDLGVPEIEPAITIELPEGIENLNVETCQLTFRNQTTGVSSVFESTDGIHLPQGLYECLYEAEVTYTNENDYGEVIEQKGRLTGSLNAVEITNGLASLRIPVYLIVDKDDFILEEIFFTGTLRPSGSQYYGDSYIRIYNNTDHVLYADGVAFCESKFKSTLFFDYQPDIRMDTMTIQSIYVIPGSGKDHPVQPGESLLICDTGIDHRAANQNSINLSHADFEWYDVSTNPSFMDIDSPTVPNLDKWYCYTLTFYVLHNRGFTSYALARIPVDKETYLRDYYYTYKYVQVLPAGTFPMENSAYKLPNSWIIDGVNCSVEAERQWNILPPSVDAGWTHCGTIDHDKTRYFKSVRRKMLYMTADGRRVLQDTNNSSNDFNTECVPSVIEEQQSAIDANGTKATQLTYDGVQPVAEP